MHIIKLGSLAQKHFQQ